MGEEIFVKLRDCFIAGYMFPQFCVDKGIQKPLFVSEKKYELFLWEIYVQFHYDKRMTANFCFIDAESIKLMFAAVKSNIFPLNIKNISEVNFEDFDIIIFLTEKEPDKNEKKILTLSALQKFFIRRTYCDIPLLKFLQRYPKVKLFVTNFPNKMSRYKDGQEFNSQLHTLETLGKIFSTDKNTKIETPLDKFGYTREQIRELIEIPDLKINLDGSTEMLENDSKLLQKIENGKRATAYQPEKYLNKIYFFGSCYQYGFYAPFDKTIESYLQQMLNENNLPYRVENESQHYFRRYQDIFYNLNKIDPAPGDIIFVWLTNLRPNKGILPFINVSDAFDPPQDFREIFCVKKHVNEIGYKILAGKYFEFLTKNNFFRDVCFNYPTPPPTVSQIWYTAAI